MYNLELGLFYHMFSFPTDKLRSRRRCLREIGGLPFFLKHLMMNRQPSLGFLSTDSLINFQYGPSNISGCISSDSGPVSYVPGMSAGRPIAYQ